MILNRLMVFANATILCLATCAIGTQDAQSPAEGQQSPLAIVPANPSAPSALLTPQGAFARASTLGYSSEQRELDKVIAQKAEDLRMAANEESRQLVEGELRVLLGKDYDQRLDGYEKQIEQMEKSLEEMRDKLQKRRDAKADMIRLRMKVLEAESDDLGWPKRLRSSAFPRLNGTTTIWGRSGR